MSEKSVQFIQVSPDELEAKITERIKTHLDNFLSEFKPKGPTEYLTRKEVAELFNVDISTVNNWKNSGKLKAFGIGSRVYFRREDIEASLIPINEG